MKTPEILFASGLVALVAGAGAALATRAFLDAPVRAAPDIERTTGSTIVPADTAASGLDEAGRRALDELRLANTALRERVAALETRLNEASSSRTPISETAEVALRADVPRETAAVLGEVELTPAFVASVDEALARIEAREDAEREERRRLEQAERVEERLMRLQAELGLSSRQSSDMRTALLAQEEKRDAVFARMREDDGDPRELRESLRTVREETHTALQGFLTTEQMDLYRQSEESEWGGRRGGPDGGPGGGWGGGRPPSPDGTRDGRSRDR